MDGTMTRMATGIVNLVFAAIPLSPVLALLNLVSPYRLPWGLVFIPWLGAFHLLLCWISGQMIARILHDLLGFGRER